MNGKAMNGRASLKPRIGLLAVGLRAYWQQFPGMRDTVHGAHARVARLFEGVAEITGAGPGLSEVP